MNLLPGSAIATEARASIQISFFLRVQRPCGFPPHSLAGSFAIIFNCVFLCELAFSLNFSYNQREE